LLRRHPHNIVAIDVPLDRDGPQRYDAAGRRLADWIADGVMVADDSPSLTLYRMDFTDEAGRFPFDGRRDRCVGGGGRRSRRCPAPRTDDPEGQD
jgi:hypothetical protein